MWCRPALDLLVKMTQQVDESTAMAEVQMKISGPKTNCFLHIHAECIYILNMAGVNKSSRHCAPKADPGVNAHAHMLRTSYACGLIDICRSNKSLSAS